MKNLGLRIVVVDKGFVFVGVTQIVGDSYIVQKAACIRRWGTTAGLGELASKGPLPNTILDPSPTMRIEKHAVLFTIECDKNGWKKYQQA